MINLEVWLRVKIDICDIKVTRTLKCSQKFKKFVSNHDEFYYQKLRTKNVT